MHTWLSCSYHCVAQCQSSCAQFLIRMRYPPTLQTAYDIRFGARPLRRWLEQHVVTELSRLIVAGELLDGGAVSIDVDT